MHSQTIFDFNANSDIQYWRIVDDIVMGGRSSGTFDLSEDGFGIFKGTVSLENNGGFSSVRYQFTQKSIKEYTAIKILLKGDGKKYQFRIKPSTTIYYSYVYPFKTSGEWQEIKIPLKDMYPAFRGRRLNQPNFSGAYIEQIVFLIGNKKAEDFMLLIDKIELQ
ncbi:CIA30 family protein [Aquimarina gracilis]